MAMNERIEGPKGYRRRSMSFRMADDLAEFVLKETSEKIKGGIEWSVSKEVESCIRAKQIRKQAEARRAANEERANRGD